MTVAVFAKQSIHSLVVVIKNMTKIRDVERINNLSFRLEYRSP